MAQLRLSISGDGPYRNAANKTESLPILELPNSVRYLAGVENRVSLILLSL